MTVHGVPISREDTTTTSAGTHSVESSITRIQDDEKVEQVHHVAPGHGESALPEDKVEEALENIEDDWENDPENARNWSTVQKWTAVGIVRAYNLYLTLQLAIILTFSCHRSQPTHSCRPLPAR